MAKAEIQSYVELHLSTQEAEALLRFLGNHVLGSGAYYDHLMEIQSSIEFACEGMPCGPIPIEGDTEYIQLK